MNNTLETSAGVKLVDNMAEIEIIAWLRARAAESGIPKLELSANSGGYHSWIVGLKDDCHAFGCGKTIDDALKMIRKDIKTPEQLAAEKREQAAKLLADADAIWPLATPQPVILNKEGAGV